LVSDANFLFPDRSMPPAALYIIENNSRCKRDFNHTRRAGAALAAANAALV
jgi:hypothetical protein